LLSRASALLRFEADPDFKEETMQARFIHRCTHVLDLEATKKFY
jgi:hypothetical protein